MTNVQTEDENTASGGGTQATGSPAAESTAPVTGAPAAVAPASAPATTTGSAPGGGAAATGAGGTGGGAGEGDVGEPIDGVDIDKRIADATPPAEVPVDRETIRADLARGLLWLLWFTIGSVIFFVGLGQIQGTVLTESIFPSLVTLTGTALGFYFGSQTAKENKKDGG